jgi:hypothetical protein
MARISTYTNASPVTLSDKFIGTEVSGTPVNVTKNFLISDLLALFQDNITLQNVLDAGNTATQNITLTGDFTLEATGAMLLKSPFRTLSTIETSSSIKHTGLSTFADNAAAIAGGLAINNMYKTATGELRIVV